MLEALFLACLAQECRSDLADLVDRLGSDSVQEREDASAILRYVGESALPDLERAAESSDAEVSARARALIGALAPHRSEVIQEMAHLFSHALGTFRAGRLDASVQYCDGVLRIDPDYPPARQLREAADRARREEGAREAFLSRVEEWRVETREELGQLPAPRDIRYPSRASWPAIAKGLRHEVHLYAAVDSTDCHALNRKLETMKLDLAFESASFEDILAFIRDFSGLMMVLDARVADQIDTERPISFKVKDLTLRHVLKRFLAEYGLDYVIKERVVLLTDRDWVCNPEDF